MAYPILFVGAMITDKFELQICGFWNLLKKQKTSILLDKIQPLGCVYEFFLGVYLLAFSVGYVVACTIFSVGAMIMEKFALQICRFLES